MGVRCILKMVISFIEANGLIGNFAWQFQFLVCEIN